MSSAGLPAMPRLVALASSATPSSASARSSQGTTLTTGPTASAISCALSSVRLVEADLRRALRREARDHGARGAARAEHDDRAAIGTPRGVGVAQALDEAVAVVVEAGERSVLLDDDCVDRADPAREIVDAIEQRKDRLLVRRGDVAAAQAERRDAAHRRFELLRRHGEQHVAARRCRIARASGCG